MTEKNQFPVLLQKSIAEIQRALPKHMDADRMARMALTVFRQNPKLSQCDPMSLLACIMQSSQLGLEPGLMQEVHLIPFKNNKKNTTECQMVIGYQGLEKLCYNTGKVISINPVLVYENDVFELEFGARLVPIRHKPKVDGSRGRLLFVYALAWLKDSEVPKFDFMTREEVEAIRDGSNGYKSAVRYQDYSHPWIDPQKVPEMWKKTMVRRLVKHLPKSTELAAALALEDIADKGESQGLSIDTAIAGEWTPVEDLPTTQEQAEAFYQDTIQEIKDLIAAGDTEGAKARFDTIDEESKRLLWVAPSKGGIFTTKERDALKNINQPREVEPVNATGETEPAILTKALTEANQGHYTTAQELADQLSPENASKVLKAVEVAKRVRAKNIAASHLTTEHANQVMTAINAGGDWADLPVILSVEAMKARIAAMTEAEQPAIHAAINRDYKGQDRGALANLYNERKAALERQAKKQPPAETTIPFTLDELLAKAAAATAQDALNEIEDLGRDLPELSKQKLNEALYLRANALLPPEG